MAKLKNIQYAIFILYGSFTFNDFSAAEQTYGGDFSAPKKLYFSRFEIMLMYGESGYHPSCGWTAKITQIGIPIDAMDMEEDVEILKWNSSTVYIGSTPATADLTPILSTVPQGYHNAVVYGDYTGFSGNSWSLISARFTCVCQATTTSCKMPVLPTTLPPTTQPPTTDPPTTQPPTTDPPTTQPPTTDPPTTQPPTTDPPTTQPPIIAPTSQAGGQITDPTQVYFTNRQSFCYKGQLMSTYSSIEQWMQCAFLCITDIRCTGVNAWEGQGRCDVILDPASDRDLETGQAGCNFYEVVWKK